MATDLLLDHAEALAAEFAWGYRHKWYEEMEDEELNEELYDLAFEHVDLIHRNEIRAIIRAHPEIRNETRCMRDTHLRREEWHWFIVDVGFALKNYCWDYLPAHIQEQLSEKEG